MIASKLVRCGGEHQLGWYEEPESLDKWGAARLVVQITGHWLLLIPQRCQKKEEQVKMVNSCMIFSAV